MKKDNKLVLAILIICIYFSGCANPLGPSQIPQSYHPGLFVPPLLMSIIPTSGPSSGGTLITLTGQFFIVNPTILIDNVSCRNIIYLSTTRVQCEVPSHSTGKVDVTIINTDKQSATLSQVFTYSASNHVGLTPGFSPSSGGGLSSGTGIILQSTLGAIGSVIEQSGTGARFYSGVIGAQD